MNLFKLFFLFITLMHLGISHALAPFITNDEQIFITADFLYWSVGMDNLAFAQSGGSFTSQGSIKELSSPWTAGFKVGVGAILPQDKWQVDFEYTRIHPHQTKSLGSGYFPLLNIGNLLGNYPWTMTSESSKASFSLDFNNLDITLGKYLTPSTSTLFMPFIGVKGAYYEEHFSTKYLNTLTTSILAYNSNLFMHAFQRFWGLGVLAGCNTQWLLTSHISLFGNFALAGLSSHFTSSRKDEIAAVSTPSSLITVANIKDSTYTTTATLDFILGFKADVRCSHDRYHLSLQAGWEAQIWFDQNYLILLSTPSSSHGNLFMQGLTVHTRFDF